MTSTCMLLSMFAVLPVALAQLEQCVSMRKSTTCAAFNESSISTDAYMIGLYPFLQGVSDGVSFDRNLTAYVQNDYVKLKYGTLFGCSSIDLDNTTDLYARFTTTVICNGVIQNSISRCGLSARNSKPVCADTCAQYALSEQKIVADSYLCSAPSNYTDTQLRADYTNCGLPSNALSGASCVEGITNEPINCGFGHATIGLCQYCAANGDNPTDPCCSEAQASARCLNIVLPSISVSSTSFLTATGISLVSSFPTTSPSSSSAGASEMVSKGSSLSGGMIAGIVTGSVACVALLLALVVLRICSRRRKRNHSSSGDMSYCREKSPPVTSAMVHDSYHSRLSSLRRPQSDHEFLPGGRSARRAPLPSEYSVPPFSRVLPSSTSDYGGDIITSAHQLEGWSSRELSGNDPAGNLATPNRKTSIAASDYIASGGRRANTSAPIALQSRSIPSDLEEFDDTTTENQTPVVVLQHDRKNAVDNMGSTSLDQLDTNITRALPLNENTIDKIDDYEILPGGRVARKSGLVGHVGGSTVLEEFQGLGLGNSETPTSISILAAHGPAVLFDSNPLNHASSRKAAPISTTRSPTMPPSSSVQDYYSTSSIRPGDKVTAVWSYAARTRDEAALERGDVLQVTRIWADGWAMGYFANQDIDVSTETVNADTISNRGVVKADKETSDKEVKAFPLICVCASEYWSRVIETGGKPLTFDLI